MLFSEKLKLLRHLELVAGSLVFPQYCPSCLNSQVDGSGWICPDCWSNLPGPGLGAWWKIYTLRGKVMVAFHYDSIARDLVRQMKFYGRIDIAREIGARSAERLRDQIPVSELDGVVPVPLHPVRIRERGYDQILVIARAAADQLQLPLLDTLIRRIRNTPPQSRLSNVERLVNLRGAFSPVSTSPKASNVNVLLVDDVIHTGATARDCIRALSEAGVSNVMVLSACG